MFDRDACRRLPSVLISRTGFIFRYASGLCALSLSLSLSLSSPSLPLFLSFSSLSSLLFRRLSLSLSVSLCLSSLSLSLSLSLSSILPFSSLSSSYYYISQLVYLLTISMNSLDFFTVFPFLDLIQDVHAKNNNNKRGKNEKQ